MKTIYLNEHYECFLQENESTTQNIQTDVFDGKCKAYIEGMRFIPDGQSWTRNDGVVFVGEMVAPFINFDILMSAQSAYEEALAITRNEYETGLTDVQLALAEIYETMIGV